MLKPNYFKWSFFSQAGLEGSGKNPKSGFFLLGLKYSGVPNKRGALISV
jgi:hypothetical protein